MKRTEHLIRVVFAVTLFWGVGCATSPDESVDESALDGSSFELASEAQQSEALGPETEILFGCSNAQIRSAQNACRNFFCGTRGSNGIHFCDQRPPIVVAQCDCRSGEDPVIQCSLTNCPQ
jgi:hypothetical protein